MTKENTNKSYSCCGSDSSETQDNSEKEELFNSNEKIRRTIREQYTAIATNTFSSEVPPVTEQSDSTEKHENYTEYSQEAIKSIPKGANLGLGSGNPIELANIQPGEIIIDLGSGAGIDCFLAAQKTGKNGYVIGIDMTSKMIEKARANAKEGNYTNVDFRLGEIEHIPVADNTADLIISNCVINLSVDKLQVFKEAYRVLKPSGRLLISDIIIKEEFPEAVKEALKEAPSCISRAWVAEEYLKVIKEAGFTDVGILESKTIRKKAESIQKSQISPEGKYKRYLSVYDKKIEVNLTPDEDERFINSIMKAHIKAVKAV